MVMGKPILAHRRDALYDSSETDLYAIMNAKEPEEIAVRLDAYWRDPAPFRAIGEQAREWYQKDIVARPLEKYLALIHSLGGQ
jgi:hypothetical protein